MNKGNEVLSDSLISSLIPDPASIQRLLHHPLATGEGVRVCVIDSGVERDLLTARYREQGITLHPIEGAVFTPDRLQPAPYEGKQSTPHGTTVADIILRLAPRVQIFSADVFGQRGTCEVEVVVRALRWAMDVWKCHLINLSLGVPEQRLQQLPRRQLLMRTIEEAYFRDVLVVAAAHNDHPTTRSYPACFSPPLVSVNRHIFPDALEIAYRLLDGVEFQAHSRGYLGPFSQDSTTSWAAPHMTGIIARLLSLRPGMKPFEVKTLLYWMSQEARGGGEEGRRGGGSAGMVSHPGD